MSLFDPDTSRIYFSNAWFAAENIPCTVSHRQAGFEAVELSRFRYRVGIFHTVASDNCLVGKKQISVEVGKQWVLGQRFDGMGLAASSST